MIARRIRRDKGRGTKDEGLETSTVPQRAISAHTRSSLLAPRPSVRPSQRRGILLLVVLSLLVLFLLVGTSFVISSNQYRKANKALSEAAAPETAVNTLQQDDLLEEVFGQLVRDTTNQYSSLRYHSLLRDLYGEDGFAFELPTTTNGAGQTNVVFAPNTGDQLITVGMTFNTPPPLRQINGYYNGLVWTSDGGSMNSQSMRIVSYRYYPATGVYEFILLRPEQSTANLAAFIPLDGARVVINGRPFNGTGAGYNPQAALNEPQLNALETVLLSTGANSASIALTPNTSVFDPTDVVLPGDPDDYFFTPSEKTQLSAAERLRLVEMRGISGLGGSDESYDAVDFQNMFLAMTPVGPFEVHTLLRGDPSTWPATPPSELGNIVLPSFHRPALLNYWEAQLSAAGMELDTEPNLLRKVMLRPSWFDHPKFTGSNPDVISIANAFRTALQNDDTPNIELHSHNLLLRMIYGPWDVDNDRDGRRDSVWVDFGAPVMMGPQGKLVKPLAAVLCVDLDGRLNLNAHGSRQLAGLDAPPSTGLTVADGVSIADLPRGQGYGPPEISLEPVVGNKFFERLLLGINANDPTDVDAAGNQFMRTWPGRYGYKNTDVFPGSPLRFDLMSQIRMQGVPQFANTLGNFATPPDLFGRYGLGINDLGQPVYEVMGELGYEQDIDTPYELNLASTGSIGAGGDSKDAPFTLGELERLLRVFDPDASRLPSRLWELADRFMDPPVPPETVPQFNINRLNNWRTLLTTDSFDLPVPNVVLPEWMRVGLDGKPGVATVDDDGNGLVDDVAEIGWQGSDDFQAVIGRSTNLAFADFLEYRIRVAISQLPAAKLPPAVAPGTLPQDIPIAVVQAVMDQLLAPELANGLKIDLNRPIGNGRDDNDNGVVDEPGEEETDDEFWSVDTARVEGSANIAATDQFTNQRTGLYHDVRDNDGQPGISIAERGFVETVLGQDPNQRFQANGTLTLNERIHLHNMRRQMLARHLYVLAMTLVDPIRPLPPNPPPTQPQIELHRRRLLERSEQLAQWAINVVDYRDPDNIMTGFEFDANPFDGWGSHDAGTFTPIDGYLTSTRDILGPDSQVDAPAATAPDDVGGLVWGAERPELLITETLAWHDRATLDTRFEGEVDAAEPQDGDQPSDVDPMMGDTSQDQRDRPKGAGFIELYNPWPAETAANADTHRIDASTGEDLGIDLARTHSGMPTGSPVWRMAVFRNGGIDKRPEDPEKEGRPTSVDPVLARELRDPSAQFTANRHIYFTGSDPGYPNDGVAFFNDATMNPVAEVRPGRYMVVGAGEDIGGGQYLAKFGENTSRSSQRGVLLRPNPGPGEAAVAVLDSLGNPMMDSNGTYGAGATTDDFAVASFPDVTSVAIIDQAVATSLNPSGQRRFTFSEPPGGYPRSVEIQSIDPRKAAQNSAWDGAKYVPTLDIPLDERRKYLAPRGLLHQMPADGKDMPGDSLDDWETRLVLSKRSDQGARTLMGFNWVYLQRLANPVLAWNPPAFNDDGTANPNHNSSLPVNPYLTIDGMGVNLTVFNGLSDSELQLDDSRERQRFSNNRSRESFASNQRGRLNNPHRAIPTSNDQEYFLNRQQRVIDGQPIPVVDPDTISAALQPYTNNLWGAEPIDGGNPDPNNPDQGTYWLNKSGPEGLGIENAAGTSHFFEALPDCTLGFMNEPMRQTGAMSKDVPETPFPWITWNNRPYVSAGELLQVPRYSAADLPRAFGFISSSTPREEYGFDQNANSDPNQVGQVVPDGPYSHLINYFRHEPADPNGVGGDGTISGMYRVLEYVGVPSRYAATETLLNPSTFSDPAIVDSSVNQAMFVTSSQDVRYPLLPPFNRYSNYREPGRVNLNTISDHRVWDGGLLHRELTDPNMPWSPSANNYLKGSGHQGPLTIEEDIVGAAPELNPDFVSSRRGYMNNTSPAMSQSTLLLDSTTPTFFGNPLRAPDAGFLVPTRQMQAPAETCTLLRREAFKPGVDTAWGVLGQDDNNNGLVDDYSEAGKGYTRGQDMQWGKAGVDDDFNGIVDDSSEAGFGDDVLNDDIVGPLFASYSFGVSNQFWDAPRNAYFRYQPLTRLTSMATTRSNVYAVWVTIGFFEVEEAPDRDTFADRNGFGTPATVESNALYDRVYPEGYQLGQEMGSETGDFQRVRGFAIIDRTIPVAFEPGEDHNVERAVRLRRRIE